MDRPRRGRAVAGGLVGAAVGAMLYLVVLEVTGFEIGLLWLGIGLLTGLGVRWGSGSGSRGLQILAMVLTYFGVVATFAPNVADELRRDTGREPITEAAEAGQGAARPAIRDSSTDSGKPTPGDRLRAGLVFVGLVVSVPLLALGQGDPMGWIFLLLATGQAAVLSGPRRA